MQFLVEVRITNETLKKTEKLSGLPTAGVGQAASKLDDLMPGKSSLKTQQIDDEIRQHNVALMNAKRHLANKIKQTH